MTIQIYPAEEKAGIADMIAKGSVTYASVIKPSSTILTEEGVEKCKLLAAKAGANPNQLDLFYRHSILASVGWNKNDDVFDKKPTWNARHTVADKQLNLGHNELNIVGHMTDSYVLDSQGNIILDNTPEELIPDQFDVVSEFVLYKIWADENRLDEVNKVIADIEDGKGFVSMECRFPAFDYAVIDEAGNHQTIPRNSSTAFLSQHLRAFGGTGEYQGYKVGRLLKDFFFTGQGIVTNPANERSIIFDSGSKPFTSKGSITIRDIQMDEKQVQNLQAELAAAKAEIAKIEQAKAAEQAKAVEEAQKSLSETAQAKTALESELATVKAALVSKDVAIAALTEELKASKEQVTIVTAETAAMKAESKKVARTSKLIAAGIEADKVDATVAKWDSLNDEQFADIVAMMSDDEKTAKCAKKAKADDDDEDDADASAKTKVEGDLAKAEIEKQAALNGGSAEGQDRSKVLSGFLSEGLQYSAKANQRFAKTK